MRRFAFDPLSSLTFFQPLDSADFRSALPRLSPENMDANQARVALLKRFAEAKKATPGQLGLAWLLGKKPWIVPSPGTTKLYLELRRQRPLSARNDVLVIETEPQKQDIEVTGPLLVKLWASSTGPDTDFTAKLVDVYPSSKDFPKPHGFLSSSLIYS